MTLWMRLLILLGIKKKENHEELLEFFQGPHETYRLTAEMEVVLRDRSVVISDWIEWLPYQPTNLAKIVSQHTERAFKQGAITVYDKSNHYHSTFNTQDVSKVLFKKVKVEIETDDAYKV